MRKGRRPGVALFICAFGALLIYGGFSKYSDQHSGTAGKATVTSCTGSYNTKYVHQVSTCTGRWTLGGSLLDGGRVAVGRIEGADSGDVGKTIDVRLHGTDHATVPSLGTAIMLWAIGGVVLLFGLVAIPWKRPASA